MSLLFLLLLIDTVLRLLHFIIYTAQSIKKIFLSEYDFLEVALHVF